MIKKAFGSMKFDFTIPVPTIALGAFALVGIYYDMRSENTEQTRRITAIEKDFAQCRSDHDAIVQIGRDMSWVRSIIEKRSTLLSPLPAPFNLRVKESGKDEG